MPQSASHSSKHKDKLLYLPDITVQLSPTPQAQSRGVRPFMRKPPPVTLSLDIPSCRRSYRSCSVAAERSSPRPQGFEVSRHPWSSGTALFPKTCSVSHRYHFHFERKADPPLWERHLALESIGVPRLLFARDCQRPSHPSEACIYPHQSCLQSLVGRRHPIHTHFKGKRASTEHRVSGIFCAALLCHCWQEGNILSPRLGITVNK